MNECITLKSLEYLPAFILLTLIVVTIIAFILLLIIIYLIKNHNSTPGKQEVKDLAGNKKEGKSGGAS